MVLGLVKGSVLCDNGENGHEGKERNEYRVIRINDRRSTWNFQLG